MWASMLLSPYLYPKFRSLTVEFYKSPRANARCALAFIPSLVGVYISMDMGCHNMKGVTKQCMVRLHLTSPGQIERKILLLEHVNSFAIKILTKFMTGI